VGWTQILFGTILILVLLFVAILYSVRQFQTLGRLRAAEEMPLEERDYLRSRAWRRLLCSLLMLVLAVMLTGALVYLENPAYQLVELRAALEREEGTLPPLSDEWKLFARSYTVFWIVFLLVLMTVVFLAALDFWATRRYGLRQHRKIIADRRAMIEREVARLRQQRNGHSG
jgi:hypothetical protein